MPIPMNIFTNHVTGFTPFKNIRIKNKAAEVVLFMAVFLCRNAVCL